MWSYDPFHIISHLRQTYNRSVYKHTSKPSLEKLVNQKSYVSEIDQFEALGNLEKYPSIDETMPKLFVQTQE